MSILTKISVVVLLVVILLACPVFISQATVAPNYRYAYEQEKKRGQLWAMDARQVKLALNKAIAERDAAVRARNEITAEKQQEIARLTTNLGAWQTQAAQQENDLKTLATEVAGLKGEAITFNKLNESLRNGLADSRKKIDDLVKENIGTSDLLKQTQAENTRISKYARVWKERIRELEGEIETLRQTGATARAGAEGVAPVAAERIGGTVTAVRGELASINIGSAKGIQREMKLYVYRGAEFVSRLRVSEVRIDQAAGIIIDRRLDPMPGDKVVTRLLD